MLGICDSWHYFWRWTCFRHDLAWTCTICSRECVWLRLLITQHSYQSKQCCHRLEAKPPHLNAHLMLALRTVLESDPYQSEHRAQFCTCSASCAYCIFVHTPFPWFLYSWYWVRSTVPQTSAERTNGWTLFQILETIWVWLSTVYWVYCRCLYITQIVIFRSLKELEVPCFPLN